MFKHEPGRRSTLERALPEGPLRLQCSGKARLRGAVEVVVAPAGVERRAGTAVGELQDVAIPEAVVAAGLAEEPVREVVAR